MANIRGYEVDIMAWNEIRVQLLDQEIVRPQPIPTVEEAKRAFGNHPVSYRYCFSSTAINGSPNLDGAAGASSFENMFRGTNITTAPGLPTMAEGGTMENMFLFTNITIPPVIPLNASNLSGSFASCYNLRTLPSIPATVTNLYKAFTGRGSIRNCDAVIRATSLSDYTDALDGARYVKLYGDQYVCEALAATGYQCSWQSWYDPIPAVTDRGQGSRTTAEDMTRMVRNGVLAVESYVPGRMNYMNGDIVRQDEWNALIEAAQSIDPSITYSSHYENLNKIEAAFESAL